jgi:broad specificity phosphatase PhoE
MRKRVGAFYYRFGTGESGADVYDRASDFLESLFREFKSEHRTGNILIVSHGLFIRLFLMRYFHWSVSYFHRVANFSNAGYVVMELDPASKKYVLNTEIALRPE